jgi:hypothetical protein
LQPKIEKEGEKNSFTPFFDLTFEKKYENKTLTCKEKYRNNGKRLKVAITEKLESNEA